MLQAIRDRAQGIFAWVMLIAVGVPFMLWGIQNYLDTGKERPAAIVGDHEIFDRDVSKIYEQNLQNLGDSPEVDEKQLRKDALEQLVREEVISQSADDRKLTISDDQARAFIQTLPYFQVEGKFDREKYRNLLASQNMSPEQFVGRIKRGLINEQFQSGILKSGFATRQDVELLKKLKDQERDIEYIKIAPRTDSRDFSDAEIIAYRDAHLDQFKTTEKVAIDYLLLNLEDLQKNIHVSEDDLKRQYEEQKASYGTPERRKISHILILVQGSDATADQAALENAKNLRERLLKGEDFAKLARESSGDSVSAKAGGALGVLTADGQEPSFVKAAEKLKQGEVSEPVKTSFGYHLIKVTELVPARYKPFEEVRDELRKTVQRNLVESKFYEQGQKLAEITFENPDSLDNAAEQLGLKVQHTGLFTRDKGDSIAAEEAIRKVAFSEDVIAGHNSEPVELGDDKAVVLRIRDHEASVEKPMAEIRPAILSLLRAENARSDADKRAAELLAQVRTGKPLAEAAKGEGGNITKLSGIKRDNQKVPYELIRAAFSVGRPTPQSPAIGEARLVDGSRLVFSVTGVHDGAITMTDKEKASLDEYMEQGVAQLEFEVFINHLRELMDVEILKKD